MKNETDLQQLAHQWGASQVPFAALGEKDQAFAWLDIAYQDRDFPCTWVKGDPLLKNLESDPRYKAFLRKMNLPD